MPTGDSSHRAILDQMTSDLPDVRSAILDDNLYLIMNDLRGFRYVYRHNYSFELDFDRALEMSVKLRDAYPRLTSSITNLEQELLQSTSDGTPPPP